MSGIFMVMETVLFIGLLSGVCASVVWLRRKAIHRTLEETNYPTVTPGKFLKLQDSLLGQAPRLSIGGGNYAPLSSESSARADNVRASTPDNKARFDATGAAFTDAGVSLGEYAWHWEHLDPHLFEAVSQMTHESITNVSDLHNAIRDWNSISSWHSPSAHLVQSVKGHLAEFLVRDHFLQAGHAVSMAELSNQPGWDLSVDGHALNVKCVADAASLHEHFAANADIPVVLPEDAANIPTDSLNFDPGSNLDLSTLHDGSAAIVDHALSNVDSLSTTSDGLDVAAGDVHAHFPVVTLAVSAFHESKLLYKGDTDLLRAAKNVSVDTLGVGGGAMAGLKIGSVIGTALGGPPGTAIGALIGGIVGGFAGRQVSNHVKAQPLHDAVQLFEERRGQYETLVSTTTATSEEEWKSYETEKVAHLRNEAARLRQDFDAEMQPIYGQAADLSRLTPEATTAAWERAELRLVKKIDSLRRSYRSLSWIERNFWVSKRAMAAKRDFMLWEDFRALWHQERNLTLEIAEIHGFIPLSRPFDAILAIPENEPWVTQYILESGVDRARLLQAAQDVQLRAIAGVVRARGETANSLRGFRDSLTLHIHETLAPLLGEVKGSHDTLVDELKRAGKYQEALP